MIIRKFCHDCDEETLHRVDQEGPLVQDAYAYCLACWAKMRETSDEEHED